MKIAILGFGVVGSGAYEVIRDGDTPLEVKKILDIREHPGMEGIVTADFEEILNDPEITAVAEAIGGLHPAHEFAVAALKAGKHFVSANKQMLATYYRELRLLAEENGVQIRFTPAAGGGIPWLSTLKRTARADRITKIRGILNGTTNYILDKMTREDADFDAVLKEAQALGYAERDPSADIDGIDVRYKCTLSAELARGGTVSPDQIPAFGIRHIRKSDVRRLKADGKTVKLLGNFREHGDAVSVFVQPTAVDAGSLFAAVPVNFNLISLTGEKVGDLAFYGQGAGKDPTGFALVQDLLDLCEGIPDRPFADKPIPVDNTKSVFRYYVRTPDVSDALAALAERTEPTPDGTAVYTVPVSVAQIHETVAGLPVNTFVCALEEIESNGK